MKNLLFTLCFAYTCSIGFEPLGDEGVCAIASALKENSTLIDLSYVKFYTCMRCQTLGAVRFIVIRNSSDILKRISQEV